MPGRAARATGSPPRFVDLCYRASVELQRSRMLTRLNRYDVAALLLFGTLIALIAFTFRDYAISNDEEVQQRYGEMIIAYYTSGFVDQALFHFRNLYLYGGLFDVMAVGLEKLLPLDLYEVRHLLTAFFGVGGLAAVWATARTVAGSRAGLLAALSLSVCGTWYGAMFNHTKDIPFAAAVMGGLYLLVLIGRELPRPRWHLVLLFGALCGCALGIRVLGVFLISYAAVAIAIHAPVGRGVPWPRTLSFVARSALPLTASFVIAYLIMIAAWPWAALAPLNPLRGLTDFVDFNYPIQTILAGHVYHMGEVPRWYVPTYMAIKLTLWLLFGAGLGLVFAMLPQRAGRRIDPATGQGTDNTWRKETALVAFAAFFPLISEVIVDGPAFTGMRHFLFTVPPIAVLAGLGLNGLLGRLENVNRLAGGAAATVIALGLGWNASTLYQLHPDEYLFFNPLVGGLAGASRNYDTDYWVNTMPEAVSDLEHYLDRTEGKARPGFHYLVAVCCERVQFEKEADSRLEWTRDVDRADFFIAPTNMNCDRARKGRVIATVERLGVVIGVVKDRRAITRPNVAGLN
jgi:Dolichyl-phosphate-mannose-protein mannosyltransferase